ncbi:MAG: 3-hydroxyacyl-ACP dehydratase FabZ family protein [Thermoguttaceae bacterium]
MATKNLIIDPSEYDLNHVIADIHEIRKYNCQRFEMEQLTAVVFEDPKRHICVAYKDLAEDEFWVRGHMPGMPIMPGVIMCEAAAQMASFYVQHQKLMDTEMVGFGGLEDVRFRGIVHPGDRFVVVGQLLKVRRVLMTCRFQCIVDDNVVCEGIIKGIPLPVDTIRQMQQGRQ